MDINQIDTLIAHLTNIRSSAVELNRILGGGVPVTVAFLPPEHPFHAMTEEMPVDNTAAVVEAAVLDTSEEDSGAGGAKTASELFAEGNACLDRVVAAIEETLENAQQEQDVPVAPLPVVGSSVWASVGGITLNKTNKCALKSLEEMHRGDIRAWISQKGASNGTKEQRCRLAIQWAKDFNAKLNPKISDEDVEFATKFAADISKKVDVLGVERRGAVDAEAYKAIFEKCGALRTKCLEALDVRLVPKTAVFGALLPPRRCGDIAWLKIVDARDEERDANFNTFEKDDNVLTFVHYKTVSTYGRQEFHLTGEHSAMLREVCGDDAVNLAIRVLSAVPSGEMFIKIASRSDAPDARENNISKQMRSQLGVVSNDFRHWVTSNIVAAPLPVQRFVNNFMSHSPNLAREYAVDVSTA